MGRATPARRLPLALAAFTLALMPVAVGCARHIERTELLALVEAGDAPTIVDVRTRGEYESAHVPGAIHIPFYAILSRQASLPEPANEEEPVVIYCEHGPRAGVARAQLYFVSAQPVRFLDGHMTAWKRDALPVATGAERGGASTNRDADHGDPQTGAATSPPASEAEDEAGQGSGGERGGGT